MPAVLNRGPHQFLTDGAGAPLGREMLGASAPQRRLWLSVITQAIRDALSADQCRSSQDAQARDDARRWLAGDTDDFDEVCELADIDPRPLRAWWRKQVSGETNWTSVRDILDAASRDASEAKGARVDAA